jgi:hypothetical protein
MLALTFLGLFGNVSASAIAAPISTPNLIATSASNVSKEVAGKAKQDLGTVQKRRC